MKWKVRVITAPERIAMKSRSKTARMHQGKVNARAVNWKIVETNGLEVEVQGKNTDKKIPEKPGQIETDFSIVHETALVVRPVAGFLMRIDTK